MGKCMIKDCSAFLSNPLFFEHFFELITHKSTFLSWSLTRALFWALFWSMKLFWTLFWGLKKVDLLSRVFFWVSLLFWGLFWVLKKALKVQQNLYDIHNRDHLVGRPTRGMWDNMRIYDINEVGWIRSGWIREFESHTVRKVSHSQWQWLLGVNSLPLWFHLNAGQLYQWKLWHRIRLNFKVLL